jgi:hypothetical protein
MSYKTLLGLALVVTVSWLLILGETYIFFAVVRPLGPPVGLPQLHGSAILSAALKIVLTTALGVLWVAVMFAVWALLFRTTKTPTAAS